VVRSVYKALKANGYDGPGPEFGELWISLFECAVVAHARRDVWAVTAHSNAADVPRSPSALIVVFISHFLTLPPRAFTQLTRVG
jgi:hypothetical protein